MINLKQILYDNNYYKSDDLLIEDYEYTVKRNYILSQINKIKLSYFDIFLIIFYLHNLIYQILIIL